MPVSHDHPDTLTLTFGCPACVERVHRSEWIGGLADRTTSELHDIVMEREHLTNDWQLSAAVAEINRRFDARAAEA